ncbi:MAG: glycosyltransferase family 2 protein [Burkholderiales bacterium]
MKTPKVSIGLPVYNGEKLIAAAIESILAQTYSDFELIITDNASTDNTEAIGREYMKRDSRVRYVRNEKNMGAMYNFDHAFELARGEYFKWAAYDDTLTPDYLEKCVRVLEQDPSIILCQAKTLYVDSKGNTKRSNEKERKLHSTHAGERFWAVVIETHAIDEYYGVMRRDVLKQTSLNLRFPGSDKVLLAELAVLGPFVQIPEYLFLRGVHAEQYFQVAKSRKMRETWMDTKAKLTFPELQVFAGYCKAAWSVPLSLRNRARCHLALLYYVVGWDPWKRRLRRLWQQPETSFGNV